MKIAMKKTDLAVQDCSNQYTKFARDSEFGVAKRVSGLEQVIMPVSFLRIPYKAFSTNTTDDNFKFLTEEELPKRL